MATLSYKVHPEKLQIKCSENIVFYSTWFSYDSDTFNV